jgi:hypothetical protein
MAGSVVENGASVEGMAISIVVVPVLGGPVGKGPIAVTPLDGTTRGASSVGTQPSGGATSKYIDTNPVSVNWQNRAKRSGKLRFDQANLPAVFEKPPVKNPVTGDGVNGIVAKPSSIEKRPPWVTSNNWVLMITNSSASAMFSVEKPLVPMYCGGVTRAFKEFAMLSIEKRLVRTSRAGMIAPLAGLNEGLLICTMNTWSSPAGTTTPVCTGKELELPGPLIDDQHAFCFLTRS